MRPVTVDDYMPFKSNGRSQSLYLGQLGHQGGLWGALMEKMWSKLNGNYENTSGGDMTEGFFALTGNPTQVLKTDSFKGNVENAYAVLKKLDSQGFMIAAGSRPG